MVNKNSKKKAKKTEKDKVEDKWARYKTFIINNKGKVERLTPMAKKIGLHVNKLKEMLFAHNQLMEAGLIDLSLDTKGSILLIKVLDDEDILFKKELRNNIANINNKIDDIVKKLKELKKK